MFELLRTRVQFPPSPHVNPPFMGGFLYLDMSERINSSITAERFSKLRAGYRVPFSNNEFLYKTHLVNVEGGIGVPLMWEGDFPSNPGLLVKGIYSLCRWTNIQNTALVIARTGFGLGEGKLIITHTPQGTSAEYLRELGFSKSFTKNALAPLMECFRDSMIRDLIALAHSLDLGIVVGTPAFAHRKVVNGHITEDEGKKIMDEPFERTGFKLDEQTRKYVYEVNASTNA